MATIHICDKCGVRPFESWYGLNVHEYNCDGRDIYKSNSLQLCRQCYEELMSDFDIIKRNTPDVEVKVVS